MRIFLRTILAFTIAPLLWCMIMAMVNHRTMESEPFPVHAHTLAIGDSHIGCSLDTNILRGSQNIALPAEPYLLSWYKLKHILEHQRIDTVYLGFAPHNLSDKDHRKFRDNGWATERLMKRIYPLVPFGEALRSPLHHQTYLRTLFMQYCVVPRETHVHYIGEFSGMVSKFQNDGTEACARHYAEDDGTVAPLSDLGIACLDSIVELARREHITLYLVGVPLHSSYRRGIPGIYQQRYAELARKYSALGIPVIDETTLFAGDSLFVNSDHVNGRGARKFSRTLRDVLPVYKGSSPVH